MKKKVFVSEHLHEFAKRGRKPKVKEPQEGDDWYSADDEFDTPAMVGPEEIEDVTIEDDVADASVMKKVAKVLDNELSVSEFNRGALSFRIRKTGEKVNGIPMAKMGGGKSYLFKTKTGMKKVNLEDILAESEQPKKFVAESIKDYEKKSNS